MKGIIFVVLGILCCGMAHGLPVGNPSDASLLYDGLIWEECCVDPCNPCSSWCDGWSVRAGFYGDYVFNRNVEFDSGTGMDIEQLELYTNAGFLAFNVCNRFDLFATLGASTLYWDTNSPSGDSHAWLETEADFSWSLGARATLWECRCFSLGAEGQYFFTHPSVILTHDQITGSQYPSTEDVKYREWQLAAGVSYHYYIFVPYAAVKFSRANVIYKNDDIPDMESKKHWGYAIGVSIVDCERASLTVEGRFADEKAVHINGQLRF